VVIWGLKNISYHMIFIPSFIKICQILGTIFISVVKSDGQIDKYQQCGFWQNRSTTDQIFSICQILERKWEYNEAVHQLFIPQTATQGQIWLQPSFFFDNFFGVSYDTNLRDFVTTSVL
jgi:hypothetical protein